MKKIIANCSLVAATLFGDDGFTQIHHNSDLSAIAFPLNQDQGWYTQESLLIWRPYLEDVDYANRRKTKSEGTSSFASSAPALEDVDVTIKKPDFNWSTGVRLGIGRYLPHDLWDISLWTTYFYGSAEDESSPQRANNTVLTNTWDADPLNTGGLTKGKVNWHINFFTWDLNFGRQYWMTSSITAHPFFGIRTAAIYQDYASKYSDEHRIGTFTSFLVSLKEKFSGEDRYIGVGPRLGTDFVFTFKKNWALTGSFAAACFYGHYHMKEKIYEQRSINGVPRFIRGYKGHDANYDVRPQIEGSLGLAVESWVRNHTVRIVPSIVFEASTWFMMNDFLRFSHQGAYFIGQFTAIDADRKSGDLSFIGVNVNLHIDF